MSQSTYFHDHDDEGADADDHNDDGYRMILMFTVNLTALLLNHNHRDIGLEFLAQLGGDELQEILKEAGITNAVHRYEDQQFQGTGVY